MSGQVCPRGPGANSRLQLASEKQGRACPRGKARFLWEGCCDACASHLSHLSAIRSDLSPLGTSQFDSDYSVADGASPFFSPGKWRTLSQTPPLPSPPGDPRILLTIQPSFSKPVELSRSGRRLLPSSRPQPRPPRVASSSPHPTARKRAAHPESPSCPCRPWPDPYPSSPPVRTGPRFPGPRSSWPRRFPSGACRRRQDRARPCARARRWRRSSAPPW